ncbi:MAG: ABC transporter ATP-binding protein [bacterium]
MIPLIKIKNLYKSFYDGDKKIEIFKDINLEIYSGEIFAIMGASGSGKTTFLHLIAGLDKFYQGEILFDGVNISQLNDKKMTSFRNQKIGYIFQFFNLLPEFTSIENVMMPLLIKREYFKTAYQKSEKILLELGLKEQKDQKITELSGGEQQRIAIARALVNDPVLLLADEPLGSLDPENKIKIKDLLWEMNKKKKQTIIMVTHDEEISRDAHRMVKIINRKMV